MKEIKFKASRKLSRSNKDYRKIIKSGSLEFDIDREDDDVITIREDSITGYKILIDCDKETGEFNIRF